MKKVLQVDVQTQRGTKWKKVGRAVDKTGRDVRVGRKKGLGGDKLKRGETPKGHKKETRKKKKDSLGLNWTNGFKW